MALQINTFEDLLQIVNTHPEWRRRLVKALFPEIDLPKALQELIELNRQMRIQMGEVQTRLTRMEDRQTSAEERMTRMEGDVAWLKGSSYEKDVNSKIGSIFGINLRRGHDGRNEIGQQLDTGEEAGQISAEEYTQVLAADLLWSGRLKPSNEPVTLVVETSWLAEQSDIERAVTRARILSKIGIRALPVVVAQTWLADAQRTARNKKVVIVQEFSLDRDSWETAMLA